MSVIFYSISYGKKIVKHWSLVISVQGRKRFLSEGELSQGSRDGAQLCNVDSLVDGTPIQVKFGQRPRSLRGQVEFSDGKRKRVENRR